MSQLRNEFFTVALCGFKSQTEMYATKYSHLLYIRNAYGETVVEEYKRRGGVDPTIVKIITPLTIKKVKTVLFLND